MKTLKFKLKLKKSRKIIRKELREIKFYHRFKYTNKFLYNSNNIISRKVRIRNFYKGEITSHKYNPRWITEVPKKCRKGAWKRLRKMFPKYKIRPGKRREVGKLHCHFIEIKIKIKIKI